MGVNVRPAAREALRQLGNRWSGHPAASAVGQCLAAAVGGLILAGAAAGPVLLPLPLALSMALGLGLRSFGAYAGGCLGYALLWGWDRGMESMGAGLLAEACLCIFGDQLSRENRWFAPGCAAVFTLLVGFLFLLEQRFAPLRFARISHSEIVTLNKVTALDLTLTGTIRVTLSDGTVCWASRRYVRRIKEVLGL